MWWPEGYDPIGDQSYGGNADVLVLEGHFLMDG